MNLPIWFEFYTRLTIFVQQRRNATLYIHAYVNLPWMTITQSIRQTVYEMFSRNIPTEVLLCVREVKFRLLLLSWLHHDAEDEVIINSSVIFFTPYLPRRHSLGVTCNFYCNSKELCLQMSTLSHVNSLKTVSKRK